jgi:hypothetical protein
MSISGGFLKKKAAVSRSESIPKAEKTGGGQAKL